MSQPAADPTEFQNLPFEPDLGKYPILANVKGGRFIIMDQKRLPADLFWKHRDLLTRSYWERAPSTEWDVQYAAFANHMKDIKDPEKHPELWIKEAEKLVPYNYSERVAKARYFPPYQIKQYNSVLELLSRTRARSATIEARPIYARAHSFTKMDVRRFFETPRPEEAAIAFPQVPEHQREQWFDLLMHFTIGAAVQPEAEGVKRCFDKETRLLRSYHHNHPCSGAAQRYTGGWAYWRTVLDALYHKVAVCGEQKQALRRSMIENPDFNLAKTQYDKLRRCINTRIHKNNILGHISREKVPTVDSSKKYALTWFQINQITEDNGEWGPRTKNPHLHSQEEADAVNAKYQEAIKFNREY